MRSSATVGRLFSTLAGAVSCSVLACTPSLSWVEEPPDEEPPQLTEPAGPELCVVTTLAEVSSLQASALGIVVASALPGVEPAEVLLHRLQGVGCDLSPEGRPIAAEALLDVDDRGGIYAFPAEAKSASTLSTMLPGEYRQSMVTKVDPSDNVTKLLAAGRGIWSFGVAPAGDALWVTACGPNGVFSVTSDGVVAGKIDPENLSGVLTDDQTYWSRSDCMPTDPPSKTCGDHLVRTTPEGSKQFGPVAMDFGAGIEEAASLSRCGSNVCGIFSKAVVVWGSEGQVLQTVTLKDANALPSEYLADASGNQYGIYFLLRGDAGTRVVFVPLRTAV